MRILLLSNAPWAKSGYGTQVNSLARRLLADGHEVAVHANAGLDMVRMVWNGITVLPTGGTQYGNEIFADHYRWWMRGEPGWAITLYDAWTIDRAFLDPSMNIASWVPVDHDPVPANVAAWCQDHLTIAMSRFGQRKLAEVGISEDVHYIPHALEPAFRPTPLLPTGQTVRESMRLPESAFVVMIAAANHGTALNDRKSFSEMFQAFGIFAASHPDASLYVHSATMEPGGIPLRILAEACGIKPAQIGFPQQWAYKAGDHTAETMAALYSAADVLLATSRGEGFGIPVIEAQACGTPVIVSDWTAQPELLRAGWKVPVQPLWDPHQSAWWGLPSVLAIVEALEEAYARRGDAELSAQAQTVLPEYDFDAVYDGSWRPLVAEMERRARPSTSRAALRQARARELQSAPAAVGVNRASKRELARKRGKGKAA